MYVANRQDFIASLDQRSRDGLEVCAHAKRWLLATVDEVGFADFRGEDYRVMSRLGGALSSRGSEAALWGKVFIDLWFCSNFGGRHWAQLVARDPANVGFAIQAAHWVFAQSRSDSAPALAAILNCCNCWMVAVQAIPVTNKEAHWRWFQQCVLPQRRLGPG
jgi:hypothetical protein